jgi:hypothetical protein
VHGDSDASRTAPAQLHRLKTLLQRREAEAFANELNLDPEQIRDWFARGLTHEGYGAEVSKAIGTLVLSRLVATGGAAKATNQTETPRAPIPESEAATPLWVKVFATMFFAIVLLFLVLMFTRGPHRGPGRHGLHGPGRDTPAGSHR